MDKDKYEKKCLMLKAGKPSIVSSYQFLCELLYIIEGQKQIADRDYAPRVTALKNCEILTATLVANDKKRCVEIF